MSVSFKLISLIFITLSLSPSVTYEKKRMRRLFVVITNIFFEIINNQILQIKTEQIKTESLNLFSIFGLKFIT